LDDVRAATCVPDSAADFGVLGGATVGTRGCRDRGVAFGAGLGVGLIVATTGGVAIFGTAGGVGVTTFGTLGAFGGDGGTTEGTLGVFGGRCVIRAAMGGDFGVSGRFSVGTATFGAAGVAIFGAAGVFGTVGVAIFGAVGGVGVAVLGAAGVLGAFGKAATGGGASGWLSALSDVGAFGGVGVSGRAMTGAFGGLTGCGLDTGAIGAASGRAATCGAARGLETAGGRGAGATRARRVGCGVTGCDAPGTIMRDFGVTGGGGSNWPVCKLDGDPCGDLYPGCRAGWYRCGCGRTMASGSDCGGGPSLSNTDSSTTTLGAP
jgi:hypothetical protein